MTDWKTGWVDVEDGHLAVHRTGSGDQTLVLSHGLTDNGMCWRRVGDALADRFDIVAIDARGHGESARIPAMPFDPAQDLAQVIAQLALCAPILIGHSLGARTSASFAYLHPEVAAKIILEDPPLLPLPDGGAAHTRASRFQHQIEMLQKRSNEDLLTFGRAQHPTWDAQEFPDWIASKRQVDPTAFPDLDSDWKSTFTGLKVPTLLLYGGTKMGGLVTPDLARTAATSNSNIMTVEIDKAGHNIRRENFDAYLEVVSSFLAKP